MPLPIPGLKVESDNQKVKFLTIFGRPKTKIFRRFRGVPGGPKALDMDTLAARTQGNPPGDSPGDPPGDMHVVLPGCLEAGRQDTSTGKPELHGSE